jgi:hypothetical protein
MASSGSNSAAQASGHPGDVHFLGKPDDVDRAVSPLAWVGALLRPPDASTRWPCRGVRSGLTVKPDCMPRPDGFVRSPAQKPNCPRLGIEISAPSAKFHKLGL